MCLGCRTCTISCRRMIPVWIRGSSNDSWVLDLTRPTTTANTGDNSLIVAEMGYRLATTDMGRKVGRGCCGSWVPTASHLTQCGLGQGLPLYQVASWSIQPFGHNCRNAKLRVGIPLRTIFVPSLVVKTFTGRVHWVLARYQLTFTFTFTFFFSHGNISK